MGIFSKLSRLATAAVAWAVLSAALSATGAAEPWAGIEEAPVRLIAGQTAVGDGDRVLLAVQIRLKPGWKTYWRNPGESGGPPQFDWSGSDNLAEARALWPAPKRFESFGFVSFGYQDELVLPIAVTPRSGGQTLKARLRLDYLICERICIPVNADLRLTLDPGAARPSAHGALIGRYLARVPKSGGDAPFRIEAAKVSGPAGEQVLEVTARADQAFENPDMMVEAPSPFGFGRPAISYQEDRRLLTMRLPVYPGPGKAALSKHSLTLTLVDGARASETRITLGD